MNKGSNIPKQPSIPPMTNNNETVALLESHWLYIPYEKSLIDINEISCLRQSESIGRPYNDDFFYLTINFKGGWSYTIDYDSRSDRDKIFWEIYKMLVRGEDERG